MSFLNPFALLGLTAISIPLLIHLFSRRQLRVIPFSSLEFLKQVDRRRMRWLRIRQILLLIMRMLAIAFLFLAMARPIVKGVLPFGFVSQGETTALFILDNSYSMGLKREAGSRKEEETVFEEAKKRALEIIDLLRRGDEGFLILASDRADVIFESPVHDLSLLKKAIREAPLSFRKTDLRLSLEKGLELLEGSKKLNREIFLITDLQRSGFRSLMENPLSTENYKDPRPDLKMMDVGDPEWNHTSLDRITFSDPLFFPQKTFDLQVHLQHHEREIQKSEFGTPHSTVQMSLHLFLDESLRETREVSLEPGKKQVASFPLQFDTPGYHTGYFQIEDEALEFDNRRFFSFYIPKRLNVLIVEGKEDEGFYVERALSPSMQIGSIFLPKVIPPQELDQEDLNLYQAIGLFNVKRLSTPSLSRLLDYTDRGGGLFIALGEGMDIPFYTQPLLRLFSIQLSPPERTPINRSQFLTLTNLDVNHPLLSVFQDPKKGDLTLVKFFRHHPLVEKEGSRVLARFTNGDPALLGGEKRVLLMAAPPTLVWSDLPLKALFVPFFHRIFRYLSQGEERDLDLLVGEPLNFPLDSLSGSIRVETPNGETFFLEPSFREKGERLTVHFDQTETPGLYRLHSGEEVILFAVNGDSEESDLSRIERAEIEEVLESAFGGHLDWVEKEAPLRSSLYGTRLSTDLTRPLLFLTLLFLIAEMAIARRWKVPSQ